MTIEDLYLENIDEYVRDENKIVTYKWLSLNLQVHCNTAKQMLYKYIGGKDGKGLHVTYFVSGLTKPDDRGEQMFKCVVVPEEKLEACKSTLAVLTSCHIYSVQKTLLKDSNALYMSDFAKFRENVFESNKYSSIQCERAKLRSEDDLDLLAMNYMASEPEQKPTVTNASTGGSKPFKKKPQSAIASMFAKGDTSKKTGKDIKGAEKPAVIEEPKRESKQAPTKGGNKKPDGMMAFFSKQADKKATSAKEVETKVAKKSPEKKVAKKSPEKKKSPSKKNVRREDSDDEEVVGQRKRRRTRQDLFNSDSEEDSEAESPIPPTPPPQLREATPEPETKPDSPEVMEIEDPMPEQTSKIEESSKGGHSGKRKRITKRKQVNKTYMDKDGFMVTEKVYEEVSTDASETEEPVKKEAKKAAPTKDKKSPKKRSPAKKGGQGSGKQTSLMSFFKKT